MVDVKAKYFLLEIRMLDVETEMRRLGDVAWGMELILIGLGGYSANLEAPEVTSWGSHLPCTPSLFLEVHFNGCSKMDLIWKLTISNYGFTKMLLKWI